jgi:hypothetical protein
MAAMPPVLPDAVRYERLVWSQHKLITFVMTSKLTTKRSGTSMKNDEEGEERGTTQL